MRKQAWYLAASMAALVVTGSVYVNFAFSYSKRFTSRLYREVLAPAISDDGLYFNMRRDGSKAGVFLRQGQWPQNAFNCFGGQNLTLFVHVWNESPHSLVSSQNQRNGYGQAVNLGSRIFAGSDGKEVADGKRSYFDPPVLPGTSRRQAEKASWPVHVTCPKEAGQYKLVVELVQEGIAWSKEVNPIENSLVAGLRVFAIDDLASVSVESPYFKTPTEELSVTLAGSSDPDVQMATGMAVKLLKLSAQVVVRGERVYLLSEAGSQYPMAWSRDMATIQEAFWHFGLRPGLEEAHWSELFFARQGEDGSLPDWVALERPVGESWSDKNTVQSDQELWLIAGVLRALAVTRLGQTNWLDEKTVGLTHEAHLHKALEWVLKERFAVQEGCLWTGHVADWGDVGPRGEHGNQSTKIENGAPRVCGIFGQSLLYKVYAGIKSHPLARVRQWLDLPLGQHLKEAAERAQAFAVNELWQDKRGFFAIHRHLDGSGHTDFNEDAIFALGGHVIAMESGLTNAAQEEAIVAHIGAIAHRDRDIGSVLVPPYPASSFRDPIMNRPYTYQNGGSWDWFGARAARLLSAAQPKRGERAWQQLARKIVRHGNFYEWTYPDGRIGAGESFRAGAAAFVIGRAGWLPATASKKGPTDMAVN